MIVNFWPRRLIAVSLLVVGCAMAWFTAAVRSVRLEDNVEWSGYVLLAIFVILGGYNVRKRMAALPTGTSATWLQWHIYLGFAAIALIHVHIGLRWPSGVFSWLLYCLFWGCSLTGLVGLVLTRTLPKLLTATGEEIIYERIGERVLDLHDEAAGIVQNALDQPGGQVLAGFFVDRLGPYLSHPRFAWQAERSHWISRQCANVARLAGPELANSVVDLAAISEEKLRLDRHYFIQGILKGWLFVHIPLAVTALAAVLYHTAISLWFGA